MFHDRSHEGECRGHDRTSRPHSKGSPDWVNAKRGHTHFRRGFAAMDLGSLPHLFNSLTLDDSSLALIALLAGMAGGWTLTNWRDQQLRTKKLKINRK
jgi:hypothetical protein